MRGEISEKRIENKSGSIVLAVSTFTQWKSVSKEEKKSKCECSPLLRWWASSDQPLSLSFALNTARILLRTR